MSAATKFAHDQGGRHVQGVLLVEIVSCSSSTFPATWLLMLFLGNIGANVSYWGALPGGTMLAVILSGAASRRLNATSGVAAG